MHSNKLIDGRALAEPILERLKSTIASSVQEGNRPPGLCTILIGDDLSSQIYVRHKIKQANKIGIQNFHHDLKSDISESKLLELINSMNDHENVDGILIQLPLPAHISLEKILQAVDPFKDIDGFHPENVGLLSIGKPRFIPCTPKGCLILLEKSGVSLAGANVVVVGHSNIVGKPMAHLLTNLEATVTVCHKQTIDLKKYTREADVIITATGSAHLIQPDFVKENSVIIDIGITRLPNGKIVGDANTEALLDKVKAITPVPGGVGPMTLAMLMENTVEAWQFRL